MPERTGVVKGGPQGRPAGTAAKRRPLTTGDPTTATMDNAPPTGRGLQSHSVARSAAHLNLFGVPVRRSGDQRLVGRLLRFLGPPLLLERLADLLGGVLLRCPLRHCRLLVSPQTLAGKADGVSKQSNEARFEPAKLEGERLIALDGS
jgi:hypothetical protein